MIWLLLSVLAWPKLITIKKYFQIDFLIVFPWLNKSFILFHLLRFQLIDFRLLIVINLLRSFYLILIFNLQAGFTALHLAALQQSSCVVSYLLPLDADPNVEDVQGRTPLHLAIVGSLLECQSSTCNNLLLLFLPFYANTVEAYY
jgi:ankyrin repeat protein